jgi:hypothetical protein
MTIQMSATSRTAQAQAHETTIGTSPICRIRTSRASSTAAWALTG